MNEQSTPDVPVYTKFPQESKHVGGTHFWAINVDEGWRSWILCTGMYEWAADELLARLRESKRRWPHAS